MPKKGQQHKVSRSTDTHTSLLQLRLTALTQEENLRGYDNTINNSSLHRALSRRSFASGSYLFVDSSCRQVSVPDRSEGRQGPVHAAKVPPPDREVGIVVSAKRRDVMSKR